MYEVCNSLSLIGQIHELTEITAEIKIEPFTNYNKGKFKTNQFLRK